MGRFSSRRFDSGRLHYSRGIGQGEDDEDDVLRERGPGLAKTCEPRVNRRQMLPIGVRVARLRRCQAALRKSQTLAKKATCGTRVSGAIPAARSAPAWRAGSLAVLDRRAAELRRFPSLWRSARRSHRPKPAFRKAILDGDRRSDGRYLEISASSCAEGATWTGGGHRPMVLDRLLRQRLVPMCPGVILDRTNSSTVLRTRGAGTSAHRQARPRRR